MNASRMPSSVSELFPATATSTPDWSFCQKFLISVAIMITSRHNQKLKDIRRLRRSKGDHALLEGPHLVEEAIAAGHELETVLATPAWLETPDGLRVIRHLPIAPIEIEPLLLEELTDSDSPRGILAVARLPRSGVGSLP